MNTFSLRKTAALIHEKRLYRSVTGEAELIPLSKTTTQYVVHKCEVFIFMHIYKCICIFKLAYVIYTIVKNVRASEICFLI